MENLTARFLWNASKLLKRAGSSDTLNNIVHQLRYESLSLSAHFPDVNINSSDLCKHCGNAWCDGHFSLNMAHHKNNKIKKQIMKNDHQSKLSSCRKNFLSFYKSRKDNILVKKCLVCKSITKCSISKPFSKVNVTIDSELLCVENQNQNQRNRKKKRKSGKKQSFSGLSPGAVLQARLSSCHLKDASLLGNGVPEIHEPTIGNFTVSTPVENSMLSNNSENLDETISSATISQCDVSFGSFKGNIKRKKKLKKDAITKLTKNSLKNKRKSFLSEVLDFL